jgi:hypothetical protein
VSSGKGVSLPDIPGTGDELEDYIAALFQASGHFVEKQIVEADPADLLELDIFTTDYAAEEMVQRLIEVKGGKWGYTDMFKVVGWMTYLELKQGAFFITKWDDRESAPKRMGPLGLAVVCFDDFDTAPAHFEAQGFGSFVEPELIGLWRHSYGVERKLVKLSSTARRQAPRAPRRPRLLPPDQQRNLLREDARGVLSHAVRGVHGPPQAHSGVWA